MTQAEAEAALSRKGRVITQRLKNQKGNDVWVLSPEVIDGVPFDPRVGFLGVPPKVASVTLFCPEESATLNQYDRIEALLVRQLGPTSSLKRDGTPDLSLAIREAVWSFPHLTISANFLGSAKKPGNGLLLRYEDPTSVKE